jgi:hypothetical protein
MTSSRKPVIVRKFSREWTAGYAGSAFLPDAQQLEILDPAGKVVAFGWEQVKWVCYVRDFPSQTSQTPDHNNPERLLHKRFATRPRTAGVWLRMTLNDGDELEGLAANDRSLIEGAGIFMAPPDARSNTQRIFVPRQAIQTLEVVGLIGPARPKRSDLLQQPELFPGESESI